MKKSLFIIFSICIGQLSAQDIHLSQFFNSEHLLNPARIGDFEGDFRATGNYRNQWREIQGKPLSTFILSFDKAFHYYSHEIDGGIMVARDAFTGVNVSTTKILLSGAYGYTTESGHNFRVGLQPGIVWRKSKDNDATYPSQWEYEKGDFTNPNNNENSLDPSIVEFDVDLGVQWSKTFGKSTAKIGYAANHLNMPRDSYFNEKKGRLRIRHVTHAELNFRASEKISLQPKLLWMWTAKANNMVAGANVKYNLPNKTITSISLGAYYRAGVVRNADAAIPYLGVSIKRFDLGFSYDVNISTLSADVKRRSSFEVSLIYTGASSKPKIKTLPCDRY